MRKNAGITIVTLLIAIVIMIIVLGTIITLKANNLEVKNLSNLYTDLSSLEYKIQVYYNKFGTLPIGEKYVGNDNFRIMQNPNDDEDEYYILDINKLDNLILTRNLTWQEEDVYIINTKTHMIYYPAGVIVDGNIYYRTSGEYTEIVE